MMIMRKRIKKYSSNIDVWLLCIPWSVVATTKPWDKNLSRNLDGVVLVASFEKCFFDPIDNLVSDF
jgi:hypothetical protein